VWSIQLARQSTLRPRVAVPSPHSAFQGHAAHVMQWRITLNPKDSWDTYISQGVDTFLPTAFTAHPFFDTRCAERQNSPAAGSGSEARVEAGGSQVQGVVRRS